MIWATLSLPYFSDHIADDLITFVLAEVDVYIGHADTFGIEETLKGEIIFDGVNIGDPQGIGDETACRRSPTGPDGYVVGFCVVDEIGDDEKISRKACFPDDADLIVETLTVLVHETFPEFAVEGAD